MRHILILLLLTLIVISSQGQSKKRDKVKRKYRKTEQVNQNLPGAVFHGRVRDIYRNPLAGACVEVEGYKLMVHTNEEGRFLLTNLPPGSARIRVSYLGFQTKYFDYYLQAGQNTHYIALDQDDIHLEPLTVTARKRDQHVPDVPLSVSTVSQSFAEQAGVTDFKGLTGLIPGVFFEDAGRGNSGIHIHGASVSSGFSYLSSSVAVYCDQVPFIKSAGFPDMLFDLERTEILKGPQNTLFGPGAYRGAVHFISKKPENSFGGYVTAGAGEFGKREIRGAVNIPVFEDILYVRVAGIYDDRDGYIENSSGGKLNGNNSSGGRFSVRFLPAYNHHIDLKFNYQRFKEPGVAYINRWYSGEGLNTGLWSYNASLDGNPLGSEQELTGAVLTYRFFRNEHNYWSSVSSYSQSNMSSAQDADGTLMPVLYVSEDARSELFFQEIRYNFSRRSRTNGSFGINYDYRSGSWLQELYSDDQLIADISESPGNFLLPGDTPYPLLPHFTDPDPLSDFALYGSHSERLSNKNSGWSAAAFIHFTHRLSRRIFFTGGARAVYNRSKLTGSSEFSGGDITVPGQFTGNYPNLLYSPFPEKTIVDGNFSFMGEAGFTYRFNENASFYVRAARGSRPKVLLFAHDGDSRVADAEIVNNLEGGWKFSLWRRIYMEASGFYRLHDNVHTVMWSGSPEEGIISSKGKAVSYGADAMLRIAVLKGINLFGNYSWMSSAFDSTDVDGNGYIYAGNQFALAPAHSYTAGVLVKTDILPAISFFLTPWYAWKSHFWFTEANIRGLEQPAYGLFNINTGIELTEPNVILSIYGTNLAGQKYIVGAGHMGGLFGLPTFVPGPPRMFGARLTWKF